MEDRDHNIKPPSMTRIRFWFYFRLMLVTLPLFILSIGLLVVAISPRTALVKEWKEVFLVFGTGIITFTSAYLGATFENQREREREMRQTRRERVHEYREYLIGLWKLAQNTELASELEEKGDLRAHAIVRANESRVDEMLESLPLYGPFSVIDMEDCRLAVDQAIDVGLQYWLQDDENRPSVTEMQTSFTTAIQYLDYYENLR